MVSMDILAENKKKAADTLMSAFKSDDEQALADAFVNFGNAVQEQIVAEARQQTEAENADKAVLNHRGVRQLTSAEQKFYTEVITASKANNFKQALSSIEVAMPETVVDDVFEDLIHEHPLLAAIDFVNTNGAIKFIVNKTGVQLAVWGDLTASIATELSGSIAEVDATLYKLTAFIPVAKAMLDLGPAWLDKYVRTILSEACLNGQEEGYINGTGKNQPIGMNRKVGSTATVTDGVYPVKTAIEVTDFTPETYGSLISQLATNAENSQPRAIENLIMVVNPSDYFNKIMPATTIMTPNVGYINNVLPYPTTVIQSSRVPSGKAIFGLGKRYFAALGSANGGKIEYDDSVRFFEDQRVYAVRFYGNAFPKDNNAFLYLDISGLQPMRYLVETVAETVE